MVIHEYMMGMKWVYNGYIRESSKDIKGRMGSCKNGGWPQIFEEGNYEKNDLLEVRSFQTHPDVSHIRFKLQPQKKR